MDFFLVFILGLQLAMLRGYLFLAHYLGITYGGAQAIIWNAED